MSQRLKHFKSALQHLKRLVLQYGPCFDCNIEAVVLRGSARNSDFSVFSDIDVAIVLSTLQKANHHQFKSFLNNACMLYPASWPLDIKLLAFDDDFGRSENGMILKYELSHYGVFLDGALCFEQELAAFATPLFFHTMIFNWLEQVTELRAMSTDMSDLKFAYAFTKRVVRLGAYLSIDKSHKRLIDGPESIQICLDHYDAHRSVIELFSVLRSEGRLQPQQLQSLKDEFGPFLNHVTQKATAYLASCSKQEPQVVMTLNQSHSINMAHRQSP